MSSVVPSKVVVVGGAVGKTALGWSAASEATVVSGMDGNVGGGEEQQNASCAKGIEGIEGAEGTEGMESGVGGEYV